MEIEMRVRKHVNSILVRCKGGPHGKTNKAIRNKEKRELKKLFTLID
jgi:hypothetical protein